MRNLKISKTGLFLAFFSIGVFFVTGYVGLQIYWSTKDTEEKFTAAVQKLKQDIERIESRIEEHGKLITSNQADLSAYSTKDNSLARADGGNKVSKKTIYSQREPQKPGTTGQGSIRTDLFSTTDDSEQAAIQELVEEHIKRKEVQSQINYLREMNVGQRQQDTDLHGDELNDLYRRSLPLRFGNTLSAEEREKALNELLDKYPDSYASAKALSIQTMDSARNNDIERAEAYYNMLNDIQANRADNVVLDNGMEAMPAVLHTLAWAYYRSGRLEDINGVVQSMEQNYYDSLYRIKTRGGWSLVTGEDAINRIRSRTGIGR